MTFQSADSIGEILDAIRAEVEPGDSVVVVDNASEDGTADVVAAKHPEAVLVRSGENLGFAAGANLGAASTGGELLLFLNPDVVPEPGALTTLRQAAGRWDVCQGLVTYPDGVTINTAGGELHFSGLAWAGGCERPASEAGPEREIGFASGACLLIRRDLWQRLGGFEESFFMYCEDVDLSLRARLAGARIGVVPSARFRHAYEFAKGTSKWRLLERNRWLTVLRTYPTALLLASLPFLFALEPVLMAIAARDGWLRPKLASQLDLLRGGWGALAARRRIERQPGVEFARHLRPDLASPYFGTAGRSELVRRVLTASWRLIRWLSRAR